MFARNAGAYLEKLDLAGKACQRHTLQLNWPTYKLRRKKFIKCALGCSGHHDSPVISQGINYFIRRVGKQMKGLLTRCCGARKGFSLYKWLQKVNLKDLVQKKVILSPIYSLFNLSFVQLDLNNVRKFVCDVVSIFKSFFVIGSVIK